MNENGGRVKSNLFQEAMILKNIQDSKEMLFNEQRFGITDHRLMDIREKKDNKSNEVNLKDYNPYSIEGFGSRGLSWNIAFMDNMLRKEMPILNALTYISNKSINHGIDLNLRDEEDIKRSIELNDEFKKDFNKALIDFVFLGDGYGGSGALIVIDGIDDEDELLTPLTPDKISKGDGIYLRPLTRLYQVQPDYTRGDNYITQIGRDEGIYDSTELGKPKYYRVTISGDMFTQENGKYSFEGSPAFSTSFLVHRSRLLIYNSTVLTWIEQNIEQFFGLSKIEKSIEAYKNYKITLDEMIKLLKRANVPTLLIEGIETTGRIGDMIMDKIDDALLSYEYAIENGDAVVIGKDEDLKYATVEFNHLNEQLLARKREVVASLNSKMSVSFYEKDDIDDIDNDWYIRDIQERQLLPAYKQLMPLKYKSMYGEDIGTYSIIFKSLENTTEKEKIDTLKVATDIISTLFEKNIITVGQAIDLLTNASDNVSDMLYNLSVSGESLGLDKDLKFKDFQIQVANELQTAKIKEGIEGNGYNSQESGLKGKMLGGDATSSKKNNIDI